MPDLWSLVWGRPEVDPGLLAQAIEHQVEYGVLDFRTRLLIRDGLDGLESYWGKDRLARWLRQSRAGPALQAVRRKTSASRGFRR